MAKSRQTLEAKVASFDEIYSLDSIDDSPDEGLQQSMSVLKRKRTDTHDDRHETNSKARKVDASTPSLNRTTSAPVNNGTSSTRDSVPTLRRATTIQELPRASSSGKPPAPSTSKEPLAGLFNGLHFCG